MGYELVTEGTALNPPAMTVWENQFQEGQRGRYEITLVSWYDPEWHFPGLPSDLDLIQGALDKSGIDEARASYSNHVLYIDFRKGPFPLAAVLAAVVAVAVAVIIVMSWKLFREVLDVIPPALKPLVGGSLAVIGVAIAALAGLAAYRSAKRQIRPGGSR